ncbi:MFS transporter (plasmid) [Halorarum halophilum]|uniref:MFS transporter n=1 Tax=Halorarum halophilum TaxID=2743090 RepID=A0A7D5KNW9_9EURY|nr:MFS transporter [Halobaculum halophilum]QLG29695.1 MFS transporter [Halobaculum halophilum]
MSSRSDGEGRLPTAIPWESPTVRVALLSTLLAPLGVPLVSPALPTIRDALALTDAQASLLVSAYFLTGIVLSPFIGLLADRVGRRRVLVPSLFVFSVAGAAIALRPGYAVILGIRVVQGTAAAALFITTVTLIADTVEGVQRNTVLGVNTAVLSAGAAIYPLVGGALATVSWNALFAVYLVGLPVAVFAHRVLPEPPVERETRTLAYLRRSVSALSLREASVYYGAAFLVELLLFGAVLTTVPFLLAGTYRLSPVLIGGVVTLAEVASVVTSGLNGRFAKRISNHAIVAAGFAAVTVGLLGTWWAPTLAAVVAATTLLGAGWGTVLPSIDAGVSGLVPTRFRAGAFSIRNSTTFLGRALGPVLFTTLAVGTGYRPLLLAAAVVSLAFVLVVLLLSR